MPDSRSKNSPISAAPFRVSGSVPRAPRARSEAVVPLWFSGGSGDTAVSGVPLTGPWPGWPVTDVTPWQSVRGVILSGAVDTGDDGVGVRRPGPASAAMHHQMPVRFEPGDHAARRAVADAGLAGDRGRRWPASGAIVARARVAQGEQHQALVAGGR